MTTQRDPIDDRIDRLTENVNQLREESKQFREESKELREEIKEIAESVRQLQKQPKAFKSQFSDYHYSKQAIVNLTFSIMTSAMISVFLTSIHNS